MNGADKSSKGLPTPRMRITELMSQVVSPAFGDWPSLVEGNITIEYRGPIMHDVRCQWVSADEVRTDLGPVSLSQALDLFHSRPWGAEFARAKQTGCWPTLSFCAGAKGRDGYLNIVGGDRDPSFFFIMMEIYKDVPFLRIFKRRSSAFFDEDGIETAGVEQYLNRFLTLTPHHLHQWIADGRPS